MKTHKPVKGYARRAVHVGPSL